MILIVLIVISMIASGDMASVTVHERVRMRMSGRNNGGHCRSISDTGQRLVIMIPEATTNIWHVNIVPVDMKGCICHFFEILHTLFSIDVVGL